MNSYQREQERDSLGRFTGKGSGRIYEMLGCKLTYNSWLSMRRRVKSCEKYYEDVVICDEWLKRGGYVNFVNDMGARPSKNHTLNRKNGSKVYSKDTCEWADKSLQKFDTKREIRNSSGVTGVSYLNRNNYWVAQYRQGSVKKTLVSSSDFFTSVERRISTEVEYRGFSRTINDWKREGVPDIVFKNGLTQKQADYLIKTYGVI